MINKWQISRSLVLIETAKAISQPHRRNENTFREESFNQL